MMRAIVFDEFGGPNVLRVKEIKRPKIKEGEMLIKVFNAGINPIDCKIRAGNNFVANTLQLPSQLGFDMCGQVVESRVELGQFKSGDVVFGSVGLYNRPQTYAEYCVATPHEVILKPEGISYEEAAALPIAGLAAWQAVFEHGQCKEGERVLIHAAAGGVGHLACQFAKGCGAYVIATATEKNHAYLKSLGVDECIDYSYEMFEKKVDKLDLIIDLVGGETGIRSLSCLANDGRLITVPTLTREEIESEAKRQGLNAKGMLAQLRAKDLMDISEKVASKAVTINLAESYPMEDVAIAHTAIESHASSGKHVLYMPRK